jgi:hypothetical protein
MSVWWQFRALIKKNVLTLKRSIFMTLMEIFYPILLMLVGYLVERAFASKKFTWAGEGSTEEYLIDKGNFGFDYDLYTHLAGIAQYNQLGLTQQKYFTDIAYKIGPANLLKLQQKLVFVLNALNKGEGIWNYVDPLEEVHKIPVTTMVGLPSKPLTMICYNRFHIAFVGFKPDDQNGPGPAIINYIGIEAISLNRSYTYDYFENIDELNNYITSEDYGKDDKPTICFGIYFKKNGEKDYSASLHYFNDFISHGIEDVPNNLKAPNEEMQQGPNMNDIIKYSNNGYIQIMNILANFILKDSYPEKDPYINYGFAVQKYDSYKYNEFATFAGVYFTFFIVLSYLCPLILYVLKMVVEKESRSKEVMKIMGMGEGTYFLSYFVEYFIVNIIYAFIVGYIASLMFYQIPYLYLVLYLWLFGLNVFALAFFCQSFMDTTRLALIVSCLIYCLMLFVSAAVYDDNIKKVYKTVASLLPPVNLLLGAFTLGRFEGMFFKFHTKDIKENYLNYSMATCYIMFTADFFIYLFLGYYLQNVIPHEYGVAKPWYYIFLPSYWCGDCCSRKNKKKEINESKNVKQNKNIDSTKKNDKEFNGSIQSIQIGNGLNDVDLIVKQNDLVSQHSNNSSVFDDNPNEGNIDFQNEDLYRDKDKKNDVFMLRDITKVYGDGKMACNKISFNLFRNEIFALLGRNGAGKTSLINGKLK